MLSGLQSALQGIQRSQKAIQVAADNIANLNTDGYRSRRYDSGADRVEIRDPTAPIEPDPRGEIPVNDVDPAREIVELLSQKRAFQANVLTARIADETTGTLLDLLAD